MQKYITLFFSVLLYLTACRSGSAPQGVLNEPQMISLLTDLHIVDGSLYTIPQVPDSMYKYGSAKYVQLFKQHHTTPGTFKTSLKYYATQPDKLQEMYAKIDVTLKAKIDSLNRANAPKPQTPVKNNKNAVSK
ncbi:DUF4296 domain-containing protein [Mucilaginibacter phyllosphaerae]|uniref:DUF4296 domain-containing protein n=1 Tax=Mucilaginibacter phyllosphaerae TaxID=1812349 RepID=A0A4Y8A7G6_9SPHI|nr:DUF4296 domain-containing protein [Mucilaginibacter phyllosphaerae]MBB3970754.1 hypothetical protein [Mucilaginibacter phyllosphaerae]TEW64302.1 DUF4296 domain-containing protein [Mucilaginibacter phyllosphaerae]GGH04410.1 hypothetical protein GCM10007352_07580 [Mucilaginibacter phyllosphaerae]